MSPSSINSRIAARRSHSLTRRWTSGSGMRRRSGRGGKSGPRPSGPLAPRPLPPFQPDQKTVAQHHRERMPMKAIPAPPLILIPAQFRFRFLMILLHPVAPMGILNQHGQGGVHRAITPEILPVPLLAPAGALPNQPAHRAGALAIHAPAPQRQTLGAPPPFGAFAPRNGLPVPEGLRRQRLIGPEHEAALPPPKRDAEIGAHRHHMALPAFLQTVEEIGIVPVVRVTGHTRVSRATEIGLIQQ